VWLYLGAANATQFTFDRTVNDNKGRVERKATRHRYDRLFIRHSSVQKLTPIRFELVGTERIRRCQRFPSDHWGILATFKVND
jgi:tyrosyl-DNA phosphodiesterase 2